MPSLLELFDYIAQHHLLLETGHISAQEVLMVAPEARRCGVQHIAVTHATAGPINMTVPQMQQAAKDGALIEANRIRLWRHAGAGRTAERGPVHRGYPRHRRQELHHQH